MNTWNRLVYVYLPSISLCALALMHYRYNQVYVGDSLASLPAGEYVLLGRRCLEAGLAFDYVETEPDKFIKKHELMNDWLYFDGETERRFIIDDQAITMAFGNNSCMVFDRINLFENANGVLTYSGSTISRVNPEGCALSYTYQGKVYKTTQLVSNKDSGPALSTDNMVKHLVYKMDQIFLLYETIENDYSDFGCSKKDRLVFMLKKL
ncbi:MAG: hypothetical protein ACLGG0_14575 [Bacteriovoracia bacterium]